MHDVTNESGLHALSLHVYSPALTFMTQYDLSADGLVAPRRVLVGLGREHAGGSVESVRRGAVRSEGADQQVTAQTVDELLAAARAEIERIDPSQLEELHAAGALVVDIRPERQRAEEGDFGIGVVVERNVLEWRLDPRSGHTLPEVRGHDQRVIVACSEGYASSLAAASLRKLGFTRAADLAGGFRAWQAWRTGSGESESRAGP